MHQTSTAILTCMDFRFWPLALDAFAEQYGSFDLISMAGGAKNIASPTKDAYHQAMIDNIATSIKLHGTTRLVMTNHTDCGGYGGSCMFEAHDHEIEFHRCELMTAKKVIQKLFPDINVDTVILHRPNGGGELCLIGVS